MNPITYALCQKPIVGLALFLANACAFPPLISDLPLSLSGAGTVATKQFEVRVDKFYFFELGFEFPSADAVRYQVIGDGSNYGKHCDGESKVEDITPSLQAGAGRPIPIQVLIAREPDHRIIVDRTFITMCSFASSGQTHHPIIWRKIGRVSLEPGQYRVWIKNLEAQFGLDGVKTTISLVAGHGK